VLVSDSRKLVFIHIQKTGGSTVSTLLKEHIPDIYEVGVRHQFASKGMHEVKNWDEYFKFAFVRNPWSRLVSWYSMVTKGQKGAEVLRQYVYDNSSTFEEFIRNCTDEIEYAEGVHYSFAYDQLDYVTDKNGNLLVDFIGRFENFEKDVSDVFCRVGVDLEAIPRMNPSPHKHYSAFYIPETERIVRERFKRDIEYFGYEFERPRTNKGARLIGKVNLNSVRRMTRLRSLLR
jgi:chondroitin 4-sulfotransferase 11